MVASWFWDVTGLRHLTPSCQTKRPPEGGLSAYPNRAEIRLCEEPDAKEAKDHHRPCRRFGNPRLHGSSHRAGIGIRGPRLITEVRSEPIPFTVRVEVSRIDIGNRERKRSFVTIRPSIAIVGHTNTVIKHAERRRRGRRRARDETTKTKRTIG